MTPLHVQEHIGAMPGLHTLIGPEMRAEGIEDSVPARNELLAPMTVVPLVDVMDPPLPRERGGEKHHVRTVGEGLHDALSCSGRKMFDDLHRHPQVKAAGRVHGGFQVSRTERQRWIDHQVLTVPGTINSQ
ncbi:MAG: hypothetical protein CFE40_13235 [Burkholderiales bacterium PBB1]|nr:MAG: hypothetical protein CFE40_13235 [Burkholderiales bacterium PBB1]